MVNVRYAHNIDLLNNQLLNARIHEVAGLPTPTSETAGWIVRNTLDGRVYVNTGTTWELRATNADALQGNAPSYFLSRMNHTGTQPASSISDLDTAVTAFSLSEFAVPTGPLDLGGQRAINGGSATVATDLATWGQVVDLVNRQGFKHVRLASTGNVNIGTTGAGSTVDGVTLALGDLILLKDQTDPVQNGIYVVGASNLARDAASDTAAELPSGTVVVVDQGSANSETMFLLTTPAPFVVGSDALTFTAYGSAPNPYSAGDGITIVSNVISAVAATGITVGPSGIGVDFTVVARRYDVDVPVPGSGTSVTLTHNLNRRPVPIAVMELSSGDKVETGVNYPDVNNVTLDFSIAPTSGQYRVSVG
jgi:hypothetical protein